MRTADELEEIIEHVRLHLYNRGVPCGPKAIRRHMDELDVEAIPSESFIKKTLRVRGLTYSLTGIYPGEPREI